MFNSIELGLEVSKEEYEQRLPKLRASLLAAQHALRGSKTPVIVVVSGVEGAGKSTVVNAFTEWLDPRGLETNVFWGTSDEERARPPYWRFWRTLPPRGKIGIYFGSWYTDPIVSRVTGQMKNARFEREIQRVAGFEKMLAADGARIVKLWFHIPKKEQRRRFEKLEKDPLNRWRVTSQDWKFHRLYDQFAAVCEEAIQATDRKEAPWHLIDASDPHHRNLTAGQVLLGALRQAVSKRPSAAPRPAKAVASGKSSAVTVLDQVNLDQDLSSKKYKRKLEKQQARLHELTWEAHERKVSTVAVFEGWDAAGKGGAIRRVTTAIDAKLSRVISIAAPTDEERAHHYLWRFWRHIPADGRFTVFDRSWYGRVLVERVEGFARPDEWMRAYQEINAFESQLLEHGIVLVKFWLHVSPEEQLRRFKERQQVAYKRHKITEEDWRNREKWDAYKLAVNDMIAKNSPEHAPWTIIPANDKKRARIEVIKTVCRALEKRL